MYDEKYAKEILAQVTVPPVPHGWVQWKGTDVCCDIRCTCGHLGHYDGDFMYYVRCPACKRVYYCNGHIQLIEVDESRVPEDCIALADV